MTGAGVAQHLLEEDAQSRVRALDASASFIVEAPAGAGKTELLTQRLLKLLQTVDEPEEIIAITFTNKAASEMRARVLDSLRDAAADVTVDKAHKRQTRTLALAALRHADERGWQLLANPARLRIYTIDSFCSHLARQMPLMSRFGAQPGVREDAMPHYEEAASRTLELLADEGAGEIVQQALRYFDNDAVRLGRQLAEMLARRDQWLDYTRHDAAPEVAERALARLLTQDVAAAAQYLTPALQQRLMPVARYAATQLEPAAPIALLRDWEAPLAAMPEALPMWRALSELLLTAGGTLRKSVNKNQGLPATEAAKPYKQQLLDCIDALRDAPGAEAAIAHLRQLPEARHDDEAWQIVAALGRLLRVAVAQLWLVFQSHGEVDFVEIAQRALMALEDEAGNPTDLALRLDYRIRHLLVDEFQDTSPTQVRLLQRLTRGWMPDDGRTLFAVGDPMQSIYRFRKADVGLFLRVAAAGLDDLALTRLRLWRNNRSCAPLIDWINTTFAGVFPAQDSVLHGAIRYRPFVATRPPEPLAAVHVHPLVAGGEPEAEDEDAPSPSLQALRVQEADRIIEIIRRARQERPDGRIAVLVRARAHLQALVSQIRRHHPALRFQAVEIEALAGRQVVQDLLSLTHALCHRADRVHWLAILRAPWCGLTLADLHALAGNDGVRTVHRLMHDDARLAALSADGRVRLQHLRDVLDEALAQRGRQSIARWVHGVWLMLGGPDCLWEAGDVRDVQAFFERIAALEAGGRFSTARLEIEVQQLYAAPDVQDDRLQFMTIHKSKGLEFDTVILPGLDCRSGNDGQPLLRWEEVPRADAGPDVARVDLVAAPLPARGARKSAVPTPYDYLGQLERTRGGNEDARVLYVAVTRAERCLHLLGIARRDDKGELKVPKNTFLELLWPHLQADFAAAATPPSRQEEGPPLPAFVPKLVRLAAPAVPALLGRRVPHAAAHFTAAENDTTAAGDRLEALVGVLAHRYLEIVADQGLARWPTARFDALRSAMRQWLQGRGVAAEALDAAAARTAAMLRITLQSADGRWLLQPRPGRGAELPFSRVDGDAVVTRRLDLTFVEDGVRWIIDYKTTDLGAADDAALVRAAERHRPQLADYAALFADEGLPVRMAIFFLTAGRLVTLP